MKKTGAILLIVIFIGAVAGNAFCEELAKEGAVSYKMYSSVTAKTLAMGEERLQMSYESSGVVADDSGKGFTHNAAFYALGSLHAIKGNFEESGMVTLTPTDGDKIYSTYKGSGAFGAPVKGSWTYVGGTGKYTGIEGSGEYTRYGLQNAAEGLFTSVTLSKGNYKLP